MRGDGRTVSQARPSGSLRRFSSNCAARNPVCSPKGPSRPRCWTRWLGMPKTPVVVHLSRCLFWASRTGRDQTSGGQILEPSDGTLLQVHAAGTFSVCFVCAHPPGFSLLRPLGVKTMVQVDGGRVLELAQRRRAFPVLSGGQTTTSKRAVVPNRSRRRQWGGFSVVPSPTGSRHLFLVP